MPRSFRARLAIISALAFAARAAVALAVAPDSLTHRGDPRFFHLAANLLADGHGYVAPLPFLVSGHVIPSAEHPPLWPALLSVFSLAGARSYTAHQLVGCAVGAATVACVGAIGRRVGGERVGLIAAVGCAVYPVFVAMDGSIMSEPLFALCVALVLLAAFALIDRPSLRRSALLGLALGATVLVRGEALALVVLLLVPAALLVPRRRIAHVAVAAGVALLAVAPWAVRNSLTFDRAMLVSYEDGPVLAGANCALTYHGRDLGYWRSDCLPRGHDRNFAFRSARLRRAGLRYARHHLGRLPAVEAVRLLRTFGMWQPRRHVYFAEGRMLPGRSVAVAAYWALLALAAGGAWMLRADRARLALLLSPAALAALTTLVAFGYSRFRYAADAAFLVLAAVALARAAELVPRIYAAISRRPAGTRV